MKLQKKEPIAASPKIQPGTVEWIKYRFTSVNKGAAFLCDLIPDAYQRTLDTEIKGIFSQGELGSIIDLMNGHITEPASMAGQHIYPNLADGFHLDPGMYEDKWEIKDSADFLRRFRSLTHFQKICMEIWVGEFWQNCDDFKLEHYLDVLI